MRKFRKKLAGITIMETVVASLLLASALIPCLKAITSTHATGSLIERKTRALTLAQAQINEIRARSIYSYAQSYAATSKDLGGDFLCNITDSTVRSGLRDITVSAGYDSDNNNSLSSAEVLVTLRTLIAQRW